MCQNKEIEKSAYNISYFFTCEYDRFPCYCVSPFSVEYIQTKIISLYEMANIIIAHFCLNILTSFILIRHLHQQSFSSSSVSLQHHFLSFLDFCTSDACCALGVVSRTEVKLCVPLLPFAPH